MHGSPAPYGEPDPQRKLIPLCEVVYFPWINVPGYSFNMMNIKANKIYKQE